MRKKHKKHKMSQDLYMEYRRIVDSFISGNLTETQVLEVSDSKAGLSKTLSAETRIRTAFIRALKEEVDIASVRSNRVKA